MLPGSHRRTGRSQRLVVIYLGALAAVGACLAVIGLIAGHPAIGLIAVPLAAFFAAMCWGLSKKGMRYYRPGRLAAAQDRLFQTKVMRRLAPPPRPPDRGRDS